MTDEEVSQECQSMLKRLSSAERTIVLRRLLREFASDAACALDFCNVVRGWDHLDRLRPLHNSDLMVGFHKLDPNKMAVVWAAGFHSGEVRIEQDTASAVQSATVKARQEAESAAEEYGWALSCKTLG